MIDWRSPYGEVFGMDGIKWEQDGNYFNHEGYLCDKNGQLIDQPPNTPPVQSKAAKVQNSLAMNAIYGDKD